MAAVFAGTLGMDRWRLVLVFQRTFRVDCLPLRSMVLRWFYGWVWMPDDVWAPSWVEWRSNDYCIGWAPLTPYAIFDFSSGLHYPDIGGHPNIIGHLFDMKDLPAIFSTLISWTEAMFTVFSAVHTQRRTLELNTAASSITVFAPYEISQHGNIRVEQRMISERQAPGNIMRVFRNQELKSIVHRRLNFVSRLYHRIFAKANARFREIFKTDPGMRIPASGIGPNHGPSHIRSLHIQTNTAYKDRLNVRPVKGQQKEMRQQLIKRYERDRNTGPSLHRLKEKTAEKTRKVSWFILGFWCFCLPFPLALNSNFVFIFCKIPYYSTIFDTFTSEAVGFFPSY